MTHKYFGDSFQNHSFCGFFLCLVAPYWSFYPLTLARVLSFKRCAQTCVLNAWIYYTKSLNCLIWPASNTSNSTSFIFKHNSPSHPVLALIYCSGLCLKYYNFPSLSCILHWRPAQLVLTGLLFTLHRGITPLIIYSPLDINIILLRYVFKLAQSHTSGYTVLNGFY